MPTRQAGPDRESVAWTEPEGAPSRAVSADQAVPTEPIALWQMSLRKPATGTPAVGASVVAVTSADRWLTLIDRETGNRLWRKRLEAGGAGGVLLNGDRVYAASGGDDGRVYSHALRDGRRHWDRKIGPVAGSIALMGGRVLAATDGGTIFALGVDRGAILWRRRVGGPIRSGVVPLGDGILVSTFDSLFVLSLQDGTVRRRAAAPGALLAAPAVVGDLVVIGSPDGLVAGLDADDLSERWRVRTNGEVLGGVAVARDTAFAVTLVGTLYRIPLANPTAYDSILLGMPVTALPTPVADGVLISAAGGVVLFVGSGAPTGRPLFRVDGPIQFPAVVRDRTIYVADGRGRVEAWR